MIASSVIEAVCWLHLSQLLASRLVFLPTLLLSTNCLSFCNNDSGTEDIHPSIYRSASPLLFFSGSARKRELPSVHMLVPSHCIVFPSDGLLFPIDLCYFQLLSSISELSLLCSSYHSSNPSRSTFLSLLVLKGQPCCSSTVRSCSCFAVHMFDLDHTML